MGDQSVRYTLNDAAHAARQFSIQGDIASIYPLRTADGLSAGYINATLKVETEDGGCNHEYVLQGINTRVFKMPVQLMENIRRYTEGKNQRMLEAGRDPLRESLTSVLTDDGQNYWMEGSKADKPADENWISYWRMWHFIPSDTYRSVKGDDVGRRRAIEAGRLYGEFLRDVTEMNLQGLSTTIPNFHYTPARVLQLEEALKQNYENRAANCREEAKFLLDRAERACTIAVAAERGALPFRVMHGDGRIENVGFRPGVVPDQAFVLFDLDTLMPGEPMDFADLGRSITPAMRDDEPDTSNVRVDLSLLKSLACGYLMATNGLLSPLEKELLPDSIHSITSELAMRFLSSYVSNERPPYFPEPDNEPHANLVRARAQIAIVKSIERQWSEVVDTISKVCETTSANPGLAALECYSLC